MCQQPTFDISSSFASRNHVAHAVVNCPYSLDKRRFHPFRGTVNVSSLIGPPFARATASATQPPDTPGSLMQRTKPMRDFRDAKAMAQTLRESLTHQGRRRQPQREPGAGLQNAWRCRLEYAVGVAPGRPTRHRDRRPRATAGTASYPAIPMRDLVPFPAATCPAVCRAREDRAGAKPGVRTAREVVLAVQRQSGGR